MDSYEKLVSVNSSNDDDIEWLSKSDKDDNVNPPSFSVSFRLLKRN